MVKLKISLLTGVFVALLMVMGCQKIVKGYLSDDIYYQVNPFKVQQGITTVSSALVLNGSTAPLHVELAALRDSSGNNADSILMKPRSIVTYKSTVTYQDTTIEMFNAKLKDSLVRPFNIANIGGRLQFTAGTSYVPTGTYTMDLKVSNINGERYLKNACTIIVTPLTSAYNKGYFSYRYYKDSAQTQLFRTESDPTYSTFDIAYDGKIGINQIIFKWVDKNGVPFNPKNGGVIDRSNAPAATASWPAMHLWTPFYAPVYTDSTIVQKLPDVNQSFPYFSLPNYPVAGGARIDNFVTGMKEHSSVWTVMQFSLYAYGTYYVTYHLLQDTHK